MTNSPTEEELMAFVDGELEPDAATRLQKTIDANPELKQRIAVYSETREVLQKHYASRAYEPVPERLLSVITDSQQATRNSWIGSKWQHLSASAMSIFSSQGTLAPMAVTAVAAILFVGGMLVGQTSAIIPNGGDRTLDQSHLVSIGGVHKESHINVALEETPSGGTLELSKDSKQQLGQLKLVLTFRKVDGEICRQFSISNPGRLPVSAIACRSNGNTWNIITAATERRESSSKTAFQTAAGPGGPTIAAALSELMEDVPLGLEEEKRLIQSKWKLR